MLRNSLKRRIHFLSDLKTITALSLYSSISDHIDSDISLNKAVQAVYLSPAYLSRLSKMLPDPISLNICCRFESKPCKKFDDQF